MQISADRMLTFGGNALVWALAMPALLWIRDALAEYDRPAAVGEAAQAT